MMGDVRKPCPFCGGEDAMMGGTFRDDWMTCLDCNAAGPYCATEAEAITAWNTRAEALEAGVVAKLVEAASVAAEELQYFVEFACRQCEFEGDADAGQLAADKLRLALALAKGEDA